MTSYVTQYYQHIPNSSAIVVVIWELYIQTAHKKIKEVSGNYKATTEQSTLSTAATVSTITHQNYLVTGEHHYHIGGWKLYQQ